MKKNIYDEQHCKKHDQNFANFLKECPICVGEKTVPAGSNKKKKFTRRK